MSEDLEYQDAVVPEEVETTVESPVEDEKPQVEEKNEEKDWEQIARDQKIRAEKAEKKARELERSKTSEAPVSGYSLADLHALNKVHTDDVSKVEKFAKSEGISIVDALKNEDLQAILDRRAEQRKSSEATNTKKVGGGGGKVDPDLLWDAARSGQTVDPAELARARYEQRLKEAKKE